MSDISKIEVDGTTYDVKDETGRSNYASLSVDVAGLTDVVLNDGPGSHNSIYRGKYLGASLTTAQASAISAGTFDDLFIGDYWTISSVDYINSAFDYYYRTGSAASLTKHHSLITEGARMYTAPMNESNTTEGGYIGSAMYTCEEIEVSGTKYTGLANAISTIQSAFGDHVLEHEDYFTNAVTSGYPSAGAWATGRICDLMDETMLYGAPIREQMPFDGTVVQTARVGKSQLPLFALDPTKVNIRAAYWLRDIVSATNFAFCSNNGTAYSGSAGTVTGVRPFFLISG